MNVLVREKCESSEQASDVIVGWQAQEFFILGYFVPHEKSVVGIFKSLDGPLGRGQREIEHIVVKLGNLRTQP